MAALFAIATAIPIIGLIVSAWASGGSTAWVVTALSASLALVPLGLGLRAFATAPAAAVRADEARSPAAGDAVRLTSPLAIEELRGEIERYRALERQLTQAKQEAEAAALAKNEFLATVSHEIRTPLNGIIPLLAMLRDTRLDPEQEDLVATAQQAAKQLLAIVDDILDYSKIEANKLELESVDLSPGEIVDQVARMMAPLAEAKRLRFSVRIDPATQLKLRGDPVRLRQILTNLVSNAIKFTERGEVSVEVGKVAETRSRVEIQFVVKDTGIGISPQAQQRLFKSFSQADASTTRVHGGTGLGLAICRRLVELMGGQIGVKSEVGRGSAFWCRIPLPRAPVPGVKPPGLEGLRAMIVSADPGFVARHERLCASLEMNALQHAGGPDLVGNLRGAAAMGASWRIDVVVIDAGSLGMQAATLARTLLADPALKGLLVVLVGSDPRGTGEPRDLRLAFLPHEATERQFREALLRLVEGEGALLPESPPPSPSLLPASATEAREPTASPSPAGTTRRPTPATATTVAAAGRAGPNPARVEPVASPRPAAPGVAARSAGGIARPAAAAPAAGAPPATSTAARVLLVEDNPVNRQLAQKILAMAGYQVDTAENGQLALEALARSRYDLVLMDCQMPVLDGYAATRKIREWEKAGRLPSRLPVIAMTANAMIGDREKCLAAGMDDYLTKPLDRALMLARISHHLASSRAGAAGAGTSVAAPTSAPPVTGPAPAGVARAARPDDGPAIDQVVLKDLLDVMGQALTDLVHVYLEDAPRLIAALRAAAAAGDVEGMVGPAHSLKSSSANLGATRLSEQARFVEHGARLKTLTPPLLPPVERIEAEFARVRRELEALVGGKPDR